MPAHTDKLEFIGNGLGGMPTVGIEGHPWQRVTEEGIKPIKANFLGEHVRMVRENPFARPRAHTSMTGGDFTNMDWKWNRDLNGVVGTEKLAKLGLMRRVWGGAKKVPGRVGTVLGETSHGMARGAAAFGTFMVIKALHDTIKEHTRHKNLPDVKMDVELSPSYALPELVEHYSKTGPISDAVRGIDDAMKNVKSMSPNMLIDLYNKLKKFMSFAKDSVTQHLCAYWLGIVTAEITGRGLTAALQNQNQPNPPQVFVSQPGGMHFRSDIPLDYALSLTEETEAYLLEEAGAALGKAWSWGKGLFKGAKAAEGVADVAGAAGAKAPGMVSRFLKHPVTKALGTGANIAFGASAISDIHRNLKANKQMNEWESDRQNGQQTSPPTAAWGQGYGLNYNKGYKTGYRHLPQDPLEARRLKKPSRPVYPNAYTTPITDVDIADHKFQAPAFNHDFAATMANRRPVSKILSADPAYGVTRAEAQALKRTRLKKGLAVAGIGLGVVGGATALWKRHKARHYGRDMSFIKLLNATGGHSIPTRVGSAFKGQRLIGKPHLIELSRLAKIGHEQESLGQQMLREHAHTPLILGPTTSKETVKEAIRETQPRKTLWTRGQKLAATGISAAGGAGTFQLGRKAGKHEERDRQRRLVDLDSI